MKSDKDLLEYVFEQITLLEEYYYRHNEDSFLSDNVLKDACLMKLLVIGEYTSKISDSQKKRFSEIEWRLMKSMRSYYAHNYGGVIWKRVWETLINDIPALKIKIENIIEVLEKENNGKTN